LNWVLVATGNFQSNTDRILDQRTKNTKPLQNILIFAAQARCDRNGGYDGTKREIDRSRNKQLH
jgi:hypothetical protein